MGQKPNNFIRAIARVALYRDDIERIYAILASSCSKIEISSDEFEHHSIEEWSQAKGEKYRKLEIKGSEPSILFSVDSSKGFVIGEVDNHLSKEIGEKICEVLEARQCWGGGWMNWRLPFYFAAIYYFINKLVSFFGAKLPGLLAVVISICWFAWFLCACCAGILQFSGVRPRYRA